MMAADEQELLDQLKSAVPTTVKQTLPSFHSLGVNSPLFNKSSESGHSNSPGPKGQTK
jgi:hypothetical protein